MHTWSRPLQATLLTLTVCSVFGMGGFLLSRAYFTTSTRMKADSLPGESASDVSHAPLEVAQNRHPLTGMPIPENATTTRPFAIVIDNTPEARPQWGLSSADIIYNPLVEGGITRLVAVFSSQSSVKIGPVRSARPYFIHQAQDWGAAFAHSGGSVQALELLEAGAPSVDDFNEFANGRFFWRTNARAPHNLFTSTDQLTQGAATRGFSSTSSLGALWNLTDEADPALRPASFFSIPYLMPSSVVSYTWDEVRQGYTRTTGGTPHLDAATSEVLTPTNVIIEFRAFKDIADPHRYGLVDFAYEGSGEFLAFTQGRLIEGSWSRAQNGPTQYLTKSGSRLTLAHGKTFIEVVPTSIRDKVIATIR